MIGTVLFPVPTETYKQHRCKSGDRLWKQTVEIWLVLEEINVTMLHYGGWADGSIDKTTKMTAMDGLYLRWTRKLDGKQCPRVSTINTASP